MNIDANDITREEIPDDSPDISFLDPDASNYEGLEPAELAEYMAPYAVRMQAYYDGAFSFIGIRAALEIIVPRGGGRSGTIHRFCSAGIWGIADDSSADYTAQVFADEKDALIADLRAMGFTVINATNWEKQRYEHF